MDSINTLLEGLSDKRLAFVMARSECVTTSEALKQSGISKSAFYDWSEEERSRLEEIAQKIKRDTAMRARMILRDATVEAARVKVSGLKNRDDRLKQSVATEILDRTVGKVADEVNVNGKIVAQVVSGVSYDDLQPDTK